MPSYVLKQKQAHVQLNCKLNQMFYELNLLVWCNLTRVFQRHAGCHIIIVYAANSIIPPAIWLTFSIRCFSINFLKKFISNSQTEFQAIQYFKLKICYALILGNYFNLLSVVRAVSFSKGEYMYKTAKEIQT